MILTRIHKQIEPMAKPFTDKKNILTQLKTKQHGNVQN